METIAIRRGRPRLTPEQLIERQERNAEKARIYQETIRSNEETRRLLNERVKECRKKYADIYKEKNREAVKAFRDRQKQIKICA
jgi:late competence protein required for DNA uptake (superfamily II DNA/RNA helicase)